MTGLIRLRRRISLMLDEGAPPSGASHMVNGFLAALIVINVISVILDSVEEIRAQHAVVFWSIEQVATAVFAVEYVLRVWTAVDRAGGEFRHPLWGRLHYAGRFFSLVDLVAVLPAVLGMLGAADLRVLRLLRLLRMLKLTRHSNAFSLLWAVFREESRSFVAVLFILTLTLTMSGSLMYMFEGDAQPRLFSSIPAAMWWAIETLTTVGYGDMVPVTVAGKVLGGVISIIGIVTLALFSGLLTVSFMDQLRLRRAHYRRLVAAELGTGLPIAERRRAIERVGDELGLAENEAEEIAEAAGGAGTGATCPHCGSPLAPQPPG